MRGLCTFRLHSLEQPRDYTYVTMSGTSVSPNSHKPSSILQRINKTIQGNKGPEKTNYDSEGLYKPLNLERREIRLLHIKPSLKLKDQPQCFLETVSLDDDPQFEALSYAWGDPNLTRPIRLEDREWYATINLEAGLRYLRSHSEDMVIWVDALCIDGGSVDERNSQILLMKTIYSNAERVRVWLGEPTRGSDEALAILEHVGRGIPFKDIRFDGKKVYGEHVTYLNELMNRPWWNRLWTQQEYILAKDVTLHCGFRSVNYLAILKAGGIGQFDEGWQGIIGSCMRTLYDSRDLHRRYTGTGAYGPMFAVILARGCFKDCTNPHDSIYGFLGLARKDLVDAIAPDYSISLNRALRRTVAKHISCTQSLSFFSFTTFKNRNERLLPTWVPDWPRLGPLNLHNPKSTQSSRPSEWRRRILRFDTILAFKACATRSLSFKSINETTIMLNGKYLGGVTNVNPYAICFTEYGRLPKWGLKKLIKSWPKFFDDFADHTAFPSSTESIESPFWRILVGDRYFDDPGGWRTCDKSDYEAYQAFLRALALGGEVSRVAQEYCTSFRVASADRRLFANDRGYIGLGSPEMQKDDQVYILSGGNVPYILRPVPGPRPRTFELVGDCYLHGIMYGEAAGTDEDYHDVYLE